MTRKNHLRTGLDGGNRFAGTGIQGQTSMQFDDFKKERSIKIFRSDMLPTDRFGSDKKGKEAFKKYCEEQSGEVVTYNIKDKAPN